MKKQYQQAILTEDNHFSFVSSQEISIIFVTKNFITFKKLGTYRLISAFVNYAKSSYRPFNV